MNDDQKARWTELKVEVYKFEGDVKADELPENWADDPRFIEKVVINAPHDSGKSGMD